MVLLQTNLESDRQNKLISHYQKALVIKYNNPRTHEKLAQIYQSQLQFQQASYHYIKSLQFDPNNLRNYWYLKFSLLAASRGKEKIDDGLLEEGVALVHQTVENQPNFPFARVVLGVLLTLQGKTESAIDSYKAASYQKILRSYPQLVEEHWDFGQQLQPKFMIPGFMKSGTTSLYSYVSNHPQVLPAVAKELHFFNSFFKQDIDYYLAHFPQISNSKNYITGEATPIYINSSRIAQQIFALFPEMKFIILLRNPADRAISSYHHRRIVDYEYSKFKLTQITQNCLNKTIEKIPSFINQRFDYLFDESLSSLRKKYQQYQEFTNYILLPDLFGSLYIYYLKEWMNIFPKEQFLIIKSENLFENPSATMKQVYRFLNLQDNYMPEFRNYNPGSYSPIPDNLRHQLVDFFRPYNQQLEEYLGMKFDWE
ncbi:MAG: sulfotransferase domain-containing protein [Cyanobacteria bacterium J06635_10]